MAKKKAKTAEKIGFEQSLEELERIIASLEGGELTLDESLDRYETGVGRLKACYELLQAAERRIELVSRVDKEGQAATEPFEDVDDEDSTQRGSARNRKRSASSSKSDAGRPGGVDDAGTLF